MSFNIVQSPERLTPAHTEHVYTISSTESGQNSYKYIIDVWTNPYSPDRKRVARLKSRPNSEGYLIVDLQQIIQDSLTPNIRVDHNQDPSESDIKMWRNNAPDSYDSSYVTKPTLFRGFGRANGDSEPGYPTTEGQEVKHHIIEYRIMIGEEYIDSSGNTVTNISSGAWYPEDIGVTVPFNIGSYPVLFPAIQWDDYFGDQYVSTVDTGVTIEWYDSTETTLKGGTSSTLTSGTWETPSLPVNGDILIVKSNYSLYEYVFEWDDTGESPQGWVFLENRYDPTRPYWFGQFMPPSVTTWVGADNKYLNPEYFRSLEGGVVNKNGHLYDWSKWYMDSLFGSQTGQFLNIGSDSYLKNNSGYVNTYRKRSIYVGEPVMVSFFNGYCGEFVNDLRVLVFRYKYRNTPPNTYTSHLHYITQDNGAGPLVNVSDPYPSNANGGRSGNRLLNFTNNFVWSAWDVLGGLEWFEINTWNNSTDPSTAWDYEETASEIFRYEVKDVSCFESPAYFVFLNSNGAWDTFTFGAKSVKSYNVNRKTYTKSTYKNSVLYSRQSYDPAKVVYESDIVVGLTAQTDYLQEYDSRIVEDLIRSNEVYLLENVGPKHLDTDDIPTLIPVTVNTSSVEEYNSNYQKLFQHSIEVEYNNINGYHSSL